MTENGQQDLLDRLNDRYPSSYRNKVMIKLMFYTGLRPSETISLRCKDLNLPTGELYGRGGQGSKGQAAVD
ncbi:MAG: site-specific integrase [Candidatus Acetothermia bacterium]